MKAAKLYLEYVSFTEKVKNYIHELIEQSNVQSKHCNCKALQINSKYTDYVEIIKFNEQLLFLDENGHQYHLFTMPLEELILTLEETGY